MTNEKAPERPLQKIQEIDAGKAVSGGKHLREGTKPSAPANFKPPTPVAIPLPPALANAKPEPKKEK
jgi:hypothetical protein